jgi:copper homeostasis protein
LTTTIIGRAVRATDASAIEDLSKSVQIASGRISIMPGSGINSKNVTELLKNVKGIFEIHSSCSIAEIVDKEAAKLIEFGFCNKIIKKTNQEEVRRLKERLKAFDQMSL